MSLSEWGCVCIKILWASFFYEITWTDFAFWVQIFINTDTPLVSAAFVVLLTLYDTFSDFIQRLTQYLFRNSFLFSCIQLEIVWMWIYTLIYYFRNFNTITSATIQADFLSKTLQLLALVNNYQKLFTQPFCFRLWKD